MADYDVTLTDDETAKIAETAAQFMADNDDKAVNALGATEDIVKEYLTLVTIQSKMRAAIIADADTNVSDADANTSAYSYVNVSKTSYKDADGNPLTVPVYSKYVDTSDDNITTKDPDTEVEVGTYTVAGKSYYSETVKNDDKTTTAYCFDGYKLVALVETDKTGNAKVMAISNFRNTNVSDDLFKLPANAINEDKLYN